MGPLKLTALCTVVMLVNDCRRLCLCVIMHRHRMCIFILKTQRLQVCWCKSLQRVREGGCPINTKLDILFIRHNVSIYKAH